jgi:hypothetical protein
VIALGRDPAIRASADQCAFFLRSKYQANQMLAADTSSERDITLVWITSISENKLRKS